MKKGLLTIFIIVTCVFLSECKKDPKPDVFRVTEVDVDASYKTAEINGSYTFSVIPDDMKIIYGEKDDLTDAISSKVNVSESNFHVNINNLSTETKYYYCFECYSSHSSTRSEVHSFVTLKAEKPVVETGAVENITLNFATCGGNVVSDCGADVTERGVCWSTSPNPTINDNITTNGNGTGTFTSNLINLTANTTYYVRAYANNSAGTGYGNEISFTTLKDIVKPTVKTNEVSSVVQDAAICGGVVIDDGGAEVTARGVCWSTSHNPTINGSHTDDGTGEGDFTSTITGLTAGTTYYVRAYATNEKGTSYGEEKSFMTSIYMDLPILTTKEIEDITETSATSGGEVVSDGGAPVIARGICWSTSQNPTIDDNDGMTTDGNGTGTFTSDLVNLTANTTYYVRAYATNVMGTAYGEQRSFTTEEEEAELTPPTVITSEVIDITETTAVSGGNVTDDGGATVTARGICWSISQNPTIDDNDGITTDGNGTGTFTSNLTNLKERTTYYVRAYATNEKGTSYGDEISFTTEEEEEEGCEPDGEIAGHYYVDLGLPSGVKWATCNVGASSPEDYGDYFAWGETSPKAEYSWENSVTNGEQMSDISGDAQYDAATANWGGSWRMPTKEQMEELVEHCEWEWTQVNGVNGAKVIGPNGSCIFLPAAGFRDRSSLFHDGYDGFYWSSTPYDYYYDLNYAYNLYFITGDEDVNLSYRYYGLTVRPITE
ncbi:MAG: DUF1566 domain-containing protein [Bacteroidales bacterium]|nr:DUF1566 domain-containing protein [Bacteroidales bacterium]